MIMRNIEEYRNRFFNLMESTIGDVKPLISEQDPPFDVRKINQSDYMPKSDYLGAGGQFQQNNTRQTSKQSIDNQIENNPELKAKSDLEKANIKLKKDFEVLKRKYAEEIPYEEYYTSKNKLFQNWVQQKIKNLNPTEYAKSNFLNKSINFFKKYFDYKSKPEIINKIITISKKNGVPVSADKVKHEIDNLISTYLPSISFKLDFNFNEKSNAMMYVYPSLVDGIIYICTFSGYLFGEGYKLDNFGIWEESVLHEIGHLVDGYFNENGIKFHSSDNGKPSSNKKSEYPHSSSSSNSSSFLDFDKIFPDPDFDTEIDYRVDNLEQFTRFKVLFDTLSKKGLKINSNLSKFIDSFKQCLYDYTIMIGYEGCGTKIENGILILDETCESLNSVKSKKDFLPIYVNFYNNSSFYWLFSYYTTIDILKPTRYPEKNKIKYSIDLNKMYNDWKNEYVMNIDRKQTQSTDTDFPTA
jgi:hypothetical protein